MRTAQGRAVTAATGPQTGRYAAAVREQIGWQPVPGQFTLLIVEVSDVTYIGALPGKLARGASAAVAGRLDRFQLGRSAARVLFCRGA
jgi:hypothetical protein